MAETTVSPGAALKAKKTDPDINKPLVVDGPLGKFVMRRANIYDQIQIGVRHTRLKEGLSDGIDVGVDQVSLMIATLGLVTEPDLAHPNDPTRQGSVPEDFKWEEIYDYDDLLDYYNKYMEWSSSFRTRNRGTTETRPETGNAESTE